jgi:lipopolysaccharide transport system ATP-binding protein
MGDIAIRVEKLSKQFKIGVAKNRYHTLRDRLTDGFKALFRRHGRLAPANDTIWALKDMSFEVEQGEVVGIIGPNGAGKSTLLKILSRITEPTEGRAEIYGRVGSLLEVGTGFHPELTGRENIYLNGAILGMRKAEIDRKFDEIVSFAEVERFIDTPVKHYSSGMYVRLAFAVAAHLEPEILLVDEVLAVGDAAFQRKCLGKMGDVAIEGRTVVFVSHNMAAISHLCSRVFLLKFGQVESITDPESAIQMYLRSLPAQSDYSIAIRTDRDGNGRLRFSNLYIQDESGENIVSAVSAQPVRLVIEYRAFGAIKFSNVEVCVIFLDNFGQRLFVVGTDISGNSFNDISSGGYFICTIPQLLLVGGHYQIDLWASVDGVISDYVQHASVLEVESTGKYGLHIRLVRRKHGFFIMPHYWSYTSSL